MEERLDALFRSGGDIAARWIPRRLILQNYWLYPYQELHFGNGRMVLRGPNGSGKTSVLVSAVTLVLDGDKSRSRLDPFRQGGRSIAYYLLGRADAEDADTAGEGFYHEDRTGYVALEFQHGGDGRYLTVGVGMRGRRLAGGGTPRIDSWGFVVRDGRRVGRDRQLALTTPEGVPLTRPELADRVGAGGVVVERMSDYQGEVNRALFGFAEEEDYAFLVQILLALRSPKLNKELKPSDVADILSDSLPPLDPRLLERVTGIMDDIDAARADIAATEDGHERVERVHLAVGRYANQVAQERALEFLERHERVVEIADALVDARARSSAQRDARDAAVVRLQELDRGLADLRGRLKVLRNHEAYRSRDALTAVEKDLARAREHHAGAEAAVRDARSALADSEKERSGLRDRWTAQRASLVKDVEELASAAHDAVWPHAEQTASAVSTALADLEIGPDDPPALGSRALARLADERRRRLEDVLGALAGVAKAESGVAGADSVVRGAQVALREGHDELRLAREGVDRCRDELGVRLDAWRQELDEVQVTASEVADVRERLHRLDDEGGVAASLFDSILSGAARQRAGLEDDRDEARRRASVLEVEREHLRAELDAWEARPEAVPDPRPGQDEARARLAAAGVVAVPLFQAVEVADPASLAAQPRLVEAALRESGLLDALVVASDGVQAVESVLGAEGGDRWVRPEPLPEGTATLADVLVPAECALDGADVLSALRSVALWPAASRMLPFQGDHEPSTGVGTDGRWRSGLLEGRAPTAAATQTSYLGRDARVRERDRQVALLGGALQDLEQAMAKSRDDARGFGERLDRLDAEVDRLRALPGLGELTRALAVRSDRQRRVQGLNEKLQEAEALMAEARRALGDARRMHEETLREEPSARGLDAEGIRGLIVAGDRVVTLGQRMADRLEALRDRGEELRRREVVLNRQRVALDGARERQESAARAVAEAEGRARTIEQELGQLGYQEIMAEIQRAERQEEQGERTGRAVTGEIRALDVSLETTDAEVTRLGTERAGAEADRAEARVRLADAVRAYPTLNEAAELFGEGGDAAAERAGEHLLARRDERLADLRRRIADDKMRAFQALTQEVTDSRSALIDHHPSLDPDSGRVSFRHEGRELPAYALLEILARHRQQQMSVMREKEDELYEEFFLQEVSGRIREAIERGEETVERVNALLADRPLANDEVLSLRWRPRREIGVDGADHPRLVELLKKPASVLPPEDVRWIKAFFHERVRRVREDGAYQKVEGADEHASFAEALRSVLDYRRWFTFTLHGKRRDEAVTEITNREFATRSGGEKSLAMFVPLLAAADARFRSAGPDAPKLVGLDEAFAGVDSDNINEMFAFMVSLDLSWIMTSEKLWGVGARLPVCTTYQFHRRGTIAAVRPWLWDGHRNVDEPTLALASEPASADEDTGSGAA
jgi:uncharacterized protein (TIGR02680 family)